MRLRRTGKKKQPHYRVVVADTRSPRDGRFLEILGHYDPRRAQTEVKLDAERTLFWLRQGARPTDTVKSLLVKQGIWESFAAGKPAPPVESETPREPEAGTEA